MVDKIDKNLSLRRHTPFYAGVAISALLLPFGYFVEPKMMAATGIPVVFYLIYLVLTGMRLPRLTAGYLKEHAAATDEPAPLIFAATAATIAISVATLFLALHDKGTRALMFMALAFLAVALGWLTIHLMAAVHYAHRYWSPADGSGPDGDHAGGFDFPGDTEPGIYDFLYFSFVIGMTGQTSDVAITTTDMRKLTLLHSIVSFFFNTTLVAAAVNTAVSLA